MIHAATSTVREEVQDVWYGQVVTFVARWALIVAGVVLTLWRAEDTADVTTPISLLLGLVAINFFLHGRYLTGQPMRREIVIASCIADAAIVSALIASSSWKAEGGIENPYFIFYYPVILGFALVFPWRVTSVFAVGVLAVYAALVVLDSPRLSVDDVESLVARLATLGATAVLGSLYWRIQREWRREQAGRRPPAR